MGLTTRNVAFQRRCVRKMYSNSDVLGIGRSAGIGHRRIWVRMDVCGCKFGSPLALYTVVGIKVRNWFKQ